MKKSVKLLMLGLLAVGTLAGCNTNKKTSSDASSAAPASESSSKSSENPSSSEAPSSSEQPSSSEAPSSSEESSSSSSSEPEPPQPTRDWTNEEKALMEEHLHGIILPFFDVEGIALDYDDTTEQFSIAGLAIEDGQIAEYAELYDAAEGWNDVSNQYSTWSSAPAGSFYVFERFVQTEEGKRGISVQFFGHNGSSYSTSGPFYLYASDPFCYEFPDLAAEYALYNVEGPNILEPETADLYYEFIPDEDNSEYHAAGYDSWLNASLYIYGLDEEAFMAYGLQCTLAGWVISEGEDEGEYTATYDDEGSGLRYTVNIYYCDDYVALSWDYLGTTIPAANWSEVIEQANAILAEHDFDPIPYELPAVEGEGYEYDVKDYIQGWDEVDIFVTGPSDDYVTTYGAILVEAGWRDLGSNYYEIETTAGIAKIQIGYSTYSNRFYIYLFATLQPLPTAEWPAEAVAEMLGEGITDELPAFDADYLPSGSYFQAFNDEYGMGVMVYPNEEEADIETYLEMYVDVLTSGENPFVYDESQYYYSPNGEFRVYLYEGTENNLVIELSVAYALNLSTLNTMFAEVGWDDLELEPFSFYAAGAFSYLTVDPEDPTDYFLIYAPVAATADADAAIADYASILLEAGWTSNGTNQYGEPLLLDPTERFQVELTWDYNNSVPYFMIKITDTEVEPIVTALDAAKVASMFASSGWEGFEFPAFDIVNIEDDNIYYFSADPSDPDDYCQIGIYGSAMKDVETTFDNLLAALDADENFTFVEEIDYGMEYTCGDYTLDVMCGNTSYGPAILINITYSASAGE